MKLWLLWQFQTEISYFLSFFQGSTKCNARVVTNVVEGVHKIVLESCHHTCLNTERKKRLSVTNVVGKARSKSEKSVSTGFIKEEGDEDLTLELRTLNLSIEDLNNLQWIETQNLAIACELEVDYLYVNLK